MKALLLLFCAFWIAGGVGRLLVGRLAVLQDRPLERFVYSAALGLGLAAYGVFALGMCGLLAFGPVTVWWLLLAAVGFGGMRANGRDFVQGIRRARDGAADWNADRAGFALAVAAAGVLAVCGVIALVACFLPPSGRDWDALAYHLADPKVFLQQRHILSLPTEHHSNFPFTMEMLFAVGLLYDGYALANLFHFLTAALTVLAILAFCRRQFSAPVGWFAALLFATTPLALWEATVAYIDLGYGLFATLAAFAVVTLLEERATADREQTLREWALLAGAAMGFALGIKYLALLPFVFAGALLLARRTPLKIIGVYAGVALTLAAPWYIKNIVLTRNPVYPYFFRLFPQSRYWSADRAATYQSEQSGFGFPHSPTQPSESARNLAQTPWRLLENADRYANQGDFTFTTLVGGLYAGFGFALAFLRRAPRAVWHLLLLGLLQLAAWFFVAQVGRYLVSLLPLLAVAAGYAAWRLAFSESEEEARESSAHGWTLAGRILVVGVFAGQVIVLLWGVFGLPTGYRQAVERDVLPTALSVPEAVTGLLQPDIKESDLRRMDLYSAIEWINANAPKGAGVVLYEEVRGFYLDRPYLWGNREHSAYIPYETFPDGAALTAWFRQRGYRYALLNLNASQANADPQTRLDNGPNGRETEALYRWYVARPSPPGTWQAQIADALRRGLWQPVFAMKGVIVLEMGSSDVSSLISGPRGGM